MSADGKETGDSGAVRAAVSGLRSRVITVERALALGVLALIVWSFLRESISFGILLPLARHLHLGPGVGGQIAAGVIQEAGLLVVLPGLAWLLGLVFEGSPLAIGLGAALVVEAFSAFVRYLSEGIGLILAQPAYFGSELAVALGAGLLAAVAMGHARHFMDDRERARRRLPPEGEAAGQVPPAADPPAADPPAPVSGDATGGGGSGSGTSR